MQTNKNEVSGFTSHEPFPPVSSTLVRGGYTVKVRVTLYSTAWIAVSHCKNTTPVGKMGQATQEQINRGKKEAAFRENVSKVLFFLEQLWLRLCITMKPSATTNCLHFLFIC